MLQHLRAKCLTANQEGDKSPLGYRLANGEFMSLDLVRCIQDRQKGAAVGFAELENLLTTREKDLRELIEREERDRNEAASQE